jgi:hypothetical protein
VKVKRNRSTLRKQIKSAPTFAQMWEVLINGGAPLTALEMVAFGAFGCTRSSGHGPEWQASFEARLKAQFADALFPALISGDKKPFKQLLELMGAVSRHRGNLYAYQLEKNKLETPTKKRRHSLMWALANIPEEDRVSLGAARAYLDRMKVEYRDESDIWNTLQEVRRPLFKPGDRVQWFANLKWSKKKEAGMTRLTPGENGQWQIGMLVRELLVKQGGKLVNRGMTREQLSKVFCRYSREVPGIVE